MAAKDDGVAAGVPANVLLLISEPDSDYERARRDQVAAGFDTMAGRDPRVSPATHPPSRST